MPSTVIIKIYLTKYDPSLSEYCHFGPQQLQPMAILSDIQWTKQVYLLCFYSASTLSILSLIYLIHVYKTTFETLLHTVVAKDQSGQTSIYVKHFADHRSKERVQKQTTENTADR